MRQCLFVFIIPVVLCFESYREQVPNGFNLPGHPGLGHKAKNGGASLNLFGKDFKNQGTVWTRTLCETDSDKDGVTNGEELGDPCCSFTPFTPAYRNNMLSDPGDANDFTVHRTSCPKEGNLESLKIIFVLLTCCSLCIFGWYKLKGGKLLPHRKL